MTEQLQALSPADKASMRRVVRRQLTETTRLLLKPQTPERRAWLSGYVESARKALEALR